MKGRIYLISGLGADRRAFRKLVFPEGFEITYLDWIPALPKESLAKYALRMAEVIDTSKPFYLIGLSFGGMLAVEIAKKLNPIHTFLISSSPVYHQLPWYFRMAGRLHLEKLVPVQLMKKGNSIGLRFLGAKTDDEKRILRQLVLDSDPVFMKWALTAILSWRNTELPKSLTHIHGNSDYILPSRFYKPDLMIQGGSHFMVYARAKEISAAIQKLISS